MKSIDHLKKEHKQIKRVLQVLTAVSMDSASQKREVADEMKVLIEYFEKFVEGCHHKKEEEFLIPAISEDNFPVVEEFLFWVLDEHNKVKVIWDNVKNTQNDPSKFAGAVKKYSAFVLKHIKREDKILFADAEKSLTEKEDEEVLTGFKSVEDRVFGKDGPSNLLKKVKELTTVYL